MNRSNFRWTCLVALLLTRPAAAAPVEPVVAEVETQPLRAQVGRVVQAMELAGAPLAAQQRQALEKAARADDAASKVQAALDPLCVAVVHVNPESRVKVAQGPAEKTLVQHGWSVFLV